MSIHALNETLKQLKSKIARTSPASAVVESSKEATKETVEIEYKLGFNVPVTVEVRDGSVVALHHPERKDVEKMIASGKIKSDSMSLPDLKEAQREYDYQKKSKGK